MFAGQSLLCSHSHGPLKPFIPQSRWWLTPAGGCGQPERNSRDGKHTLYPLSVSLQEPEGAGSDHQVDSAHLVWLPAPLFPAGSLNHWIVFQSLTHHRRCWLQCSHSLPRVLTVILLLSLLKNKPLTVTCGCKHDVINTEQLCRCSFHSVCVSPPNNSNIISNMATFSPQKWRLNR